MERLELRYNDAVKALETLGDILNEEYSTIIRDATVQRFEYTFEAVWKFIKEYLKQKEGVVVNSPKSCFKEIFPLGFFDEDKTAACLEMTDRRNETSHMYKEAVAQVIYANIKGYYSLMKELMDKFIDKI